MKLLRSRTWSQRFGKLHEWMTQRDERLEASMYHGYINTLCEKFKFVRKSRFTSLPGTTPVTMLLTIFLQPS